MSDSPHRHTSGDAGHPPNSRADGSDVATRTHKTAAPTIGDTRFHHPSLTVARANQPTDSLDAGSDQYARRGDLCASRTPVANGCASRRQPNSRAHRTLGASRPGGYAEPGPNGHVPGCCAYPGAGHTIDAGHWHSSR